MTERYGIIGGGVLGMTLAHRLAKQGQHVALFEAAPQLGGLASAWQLGDVTWDRHYHVTLLSDSHLRKLLADLSLEKETQWVETKTGFYVDGRLLSMSNAWEFLRFPPLRLWDKLRLGATIWYASRIKDWRALEKVPVVDWLRRLSGERTTNRIWLPLLRAKLGENYRHASAAFIWAIIARMYAARRTGLKKEMFGYVPGGYARVLGVFEQKLREEGVNLRLGERVVEVRSSEQGLGVTRDDGMVEYFDRVVVTTPCPAVARVCPELGMAETERLNGVRYQGILCASVLLKKPLAHYYVTNITDDWVPFTAVIEMTALVRPVELGGHHLVYLPKYVPADDPAFDWSDREIAEKFLTALEKMYPHFQRSDVLEFRVSRVNHVLPIAALNYSARVPPMPTSVPGLFVVNSAQIVNGTLNVNETIQLAERAVATVTAPLSPIHAIQFQETVA